MTTETAHPATAAPRRCPERPRRRGAALLLGAALALGSLGGMAGCASPPKDPAARAAYEQRNDPFEKFNRRMHGVNVWLDRNVLGPTATAYKRHIPKFVRDRIRTFADHLNEPITFINDVLQAEEERAAETAVRFFVNTVAGAGGLFDVAAGYGLKRHTEDFGQTLAVWGLPPGPYLVLPILGPNNTRHLVGRVVDSVVDPISWATGETLPTRLIFGALGPVGLIDFYSRQMDQLRAIEKNSLDYYAALRSFYRQNREAAIKNGRTGTGDIPLPGDDEDDDEGSGGGGGNGAGNGAKKPNPKARPAPSSRTK